MMTRIGFLALLLIPTLAQASPSHMKIAADTEPGARMIVKGYVYGADGKPRGGSNVGVSHRCTGEQLRCAGGVPAWHAGHGAGWRVLIDTIKPGPYPGGKIPRMQRKPTGPGTIEEIQFKTDAARLPLRTA